MERATNSSGCLPLELGEVALPPMTEVSFGFTEQKQLEVPLGSSFLDWLVCLLFRDLEASGRSYKGEEFGDFEDSSL